jgi:hypothetical protein
MYQHLFAIVDRLPASWRPPEWALGLVHVRSVNGLDVLAGACERAPAANARTLAQHHEIVAAAMDADALVPFRFGTVVRDGELACWVAAHAGRIRATLAQLRGSVEMSVKLLRLHCGHGRERSCPECAGGAPDAGEIRRLAATLVERAGIERWQFRASPNGEHAAGAVAFLVPRDEVEVFLGRIAPVASRAAGVAVVPSGPWPAYSFVGGVERLPPARIVAPGPRAARLTG